MADGTTGGNPVKKFYAYRALDYVRAPGKFGKVLLDLADRGG